MERAVKTVKQLLQQSDDHCLALLNFRSTPLPWCDLSPAELLMGRCLRTKLPQVSQHLTPTWPYLAYLSSRGRMRSSRENRRSFFFFSQAPSRKRTPCPARWPKSVDNLRCYASQRDHHLILDCASLLLCGDGHMVCEEKPLPSQPFPRRAGSSCTRGRTSQDHDSLPDWNSDHSPGSLQRKWNLRGEM